MSIAAHHHAEWLSLLEVSGPFLSLPVLLRVFPQGLDAVDAERRRMLRLAYAGWQDEPTTLQGEWVRFVLRDLLGLPESVLLSGEALLPALTVLVPQEDERLQPDLAVVAPPTGSPPGAPRWLVTVYPLEQHLDKTVAGSRWKASPATRMQELLRATHVPLGLVTNGEHWLLVYAPRGETSTFASWYAALWLEEPLTLQAFVSLLGVRRWFGVAEIDTLPALFAQSAQNQQDVTDQLGLQVRRAVEILIQALDRIDKDRNRSLLTGVSEQDLYRAALTVMMRLIFLLFAEERELLLLGHPVYDQHYAVSTLGMQLREQADQFSEEVLERRHDAWSRLLATSRLVYAGVEHSDLRLRAYGGRLFDPDRYPFLEGRKQDSHWRAAPAEPLPIHNRTVLHLLEALQVLELRALGGGPAEARRLSFRALDVEQIGHVYESLLDHLAMRAPEPLLGLSGGKGKSPETPLSKLEAARAKSEAALVELLVEETGRSASALQRALQEPELADEDRLRVACDNDPALVARVRPFAVLLRQDSNGYPLIITPGSLYVTHGLDRRSTGTHYTPSSLTESLVKHALDPLVYAGMAEGVAPAPEILRSPAELLALKVCDPACGSGAFLVQACRYLADKLVEAWEAVVMRGGWRVAGDAWRVAGDAWRVARGEELDDVEELQRTGSLAVGDGFSDSMLRGDEEFPPRRTVWDDQPDWSGGSIDSRQHRRESGQTAYQGISESSEYCQGFIDGIGNSSAAERASGVIATSNIGEAPLPYRQSQSYAVPVKDFPNESNLIPPNQYDASRATHHAPRITRHPPRITLFGEPATGDPSEQLVPLDPDERLIVARRLIADRCLFGVDKNPMAVEMAKLSLWLVTLQKDRPFTFLDHAIRSGDSLLGIAILKDLDWFYEGATRQKRLGSHQQVIQQAQAKRLELEAIPDTALDQVESKARLLEEAEVLLQQLRPLADVVTGARLAAGGRGGKKLDEYLRDATLLDEGTLQQRAKADLGAYQTFHWPLEFPEVFAEGRSGFDAVVGNPPFMGGQKITGALGTAYRDYLVAYLAGGQRGSADLCAYFYLRAGQLLRKGGLLGMLATNTIAQGDTREVGLDQLVARGFSIPRAVPSRKWPGTASLEVAHVWLRRGEWRNQFILDDTLAAGITPFLAVPGKVIGKPHRLAANAGKSFQGSIVLGMGFVLTPEDAQALIDKDPRNRKALYPYLNGEDLNSRSDQSPSRWVINFQDWPLNREMRGSWIAADEKQRKEWLKTGLVPADYPDSVAADYPDLLAVVEEKVKSERLINNDKGARQYWWQFLRPRPELYSTIAGMERVLVRARIANMHSLAWVPNKWVFNEKTVVFIGSFSILQSTIHEVWARQFSSTLKTDMQYTPSDCFETFPFPESTVNLEAIGECYYTHRQAIMQTRQEGLTQTYNRFHDLKENSADIVQLRALHVEMDHAVAAAYGWSDLDLDHGFHETRQGLRYTIAESARREVLDRLLRLNHERYAEEVRQGLHDKERKPKAGRKAPQKVAVKEQTELDL